MGEQDLGAYGDIRTMKYEQSSTQKRVLCFDQIRALMVALVIAIHVPVAFGGEWGWLGIRIPIEEPVSPLLKGFFGWYSYSINSFIMYMMFLIAGYFVPRSVHNKGVICYLRGRFVRLGIPFAAGFLLINNLSLLIARFSPNSPLAGMSLIDIPFNRIWVLWFLIVLLVFDLLYCAWVVLRGDRFSVDTSVPTPQIRSWVMSAFVLGVFQAVMASQTDLWTYLERSYFNGFGAQGMNIMTYTFLFFLGCKASFHGWLERLDSHLVWAWFRLSLALLLGTLSLILTLTFSPNLVSDFTVLMLFLRFLHPFIGWGIMAYLLMWFQRNENRVGQGLAIAGVNSYGAYVIHSLVLVVVLMAISSLRINPWLVVLTATLATTWISFKLAGQLRRIPAIARVL